MDTFHEAHDATMPGEVIAVEEMLVGVYFQYFSHRVIYGIQVMRSLRLGSCTPSVIHSAGTLILVRNILI